MPTLADLGVRIFDPLFAMPFFTGLVFAVLLIGRARFGWRGMQAVRWLVAGSTLLLLAYVGSRFVLEVVLHRATAP